MKKILIPICILILGFTSSYLWDKFPPAWVAFVSLGFLILITTKRNVWIKGTSKPFNLKERLERNTKPPVGFEEAIREKTTLNAEAKTENPPPHRMREIAKRLIFIDGFLASRHMSEQGEQ